MFLLRNRPDTELVPLAVATPCVEVSAVTEKEDSEVLRTGQNWSWNQKKTWFKEISLTRS